MISFAAAGVGIGAGDFAFEDFRHAASIERSGKRRVCFQGGIVVADRFIDLSQLQINECARLQRVGQRFEPQRFIAIC